MRPRGPRSSRRRGSWCGPTGWRRCRCGIWPSRSACRRRRCTRTSTRSTRSTTRCSPRARRSSSTSARATIAPAIPLARPAGRHAATSSSFCTDDPVRYQLLFQRTIPGFEPSRRVLRDLGRGGLAEIAHAAGRRSASPTRSALDLLHRDRRPASPTSRSRTTPVATAGSAWSTRPWRCSSTHVTKTAPGAREDPEGDDHRDPVDDDPADRPRTRRVALAATENAAGRRRCSARSRPTTGRSRPTARRGTCGRWPATSSG